MLNRLLGALALLFTLGLAAGTISYAHAAEGCESHGGYPFVAHGCLPADLLNQALELSRGTVPPANSDGSGAGQYKFWVDTSTTPATLRQCVTAGGCSATYNAAEWTSWATIDPTTGVQFVDQVAVVTGTGPQPVSAAVMVWAPTSPANTSFTLPATPILGQRHTFIDRLPTSAYSLTIAANSGQSLLLPGGGGSSFVLAAFGSLATFKFIGSNQWVLD